MTQVNSEAPPPELFDRLDNSADRLFYLQPRFVAHIDDATIRALTNFYGERLFDGAAVLDLMSSWISHLPEQPKLTRVAGLGMNAEELGANPLFGERRVHDLNLQPTLPYATAEFDAVICSLSVEYLIRPFEVFAEVARVLRPGGRFIVTFSNRWFPPKVINIWQSMHEFERPGMVLEYFLRDGLFDQLETWSIRGLPRPADDKYAGQQADSDPVYAVWGSRS